MREIPLEEQARDDRWQDRHQSDHGDISPRRNAGDVLRLCLDEERHRDRIAERQDERQKIVVPGAVSAACIALVLGAIAGYGLARFRYRIGRITNDQLSFFFLVQRLFPIAILSVPYLSLFRTLNLLDTPLALVLGEIGFGTPFVAWLLRDFFAGLPRDVEDSAMIDGGSRLQVLRHIVFPLSAPGLRAAFTLVFWAPGTTTCSR